MFWFFSPLVTDRGSMRAVGAPVPCVMGEGV